MVTVNNDTKTTEYISTTPAQPSVQSSSTPVNSVYEGQQSSNVSETSTDETLENKLNKIASQYSNIKTEDVKKLLTSICGYDEAQLQKLPPQNLDKILACLEEALKQCSKNQKVDTERLEARFRAYNTMVIKGTNSIEEANAHIEKYKNMTLLGVLQYKGYLDKNVSLDEISQEQLEGAIEKFINEEIAKHKDKKLTPEQIEKQKKCLERLIANSSDEEKSILWKAFTHVIADANKCKAFDTMISSFVKPEKLQEFLHSIKPEDLTKMGLPEEDVQKFSYLLSANLDEEGLKAHREDIVRFMTTLTEANKDILKSIENKKNLALENGTEPEFTEEELAVLQKLEIFKNMEAGDISGTANNKIITEDFKNEFLNQLINDAKANGTYEDVMGLVKEFAQNNQELTPQNFDKLMNKLTENEYQEIKTPAEKRQENAKTADVGFIQKEEPVDTSRLTALKQQISSTTTEEKPEFRVDKSSTNPINKKETLDSKMREASTAQDKLAIIKEFFDKSPILKIALENYLKGATDPLAILNALPSNARKYLANKLVKKCALKEDEIQKLNLSYGEKQLLLNTYRETQKQVETV